MTAAFQDAPDSATYRANGPILRFVLRVLGWSQAEFGRRLAIHESTAGRILKGTAPLTAGNARRLLDLVPGLRIEEVISLPGLSPELPAGVLDGDAAQPTFTVECLSRELAQGFAAYLRSDEKLSGVTVEGTDVRVEWSGSVASFAIDVYGLAVNGGFAADEVAAREMAETLRTMPGVN
jgi:transcriptional regulator with XRE-family HTH domain